ncbi:MAG: phosphoglycolate phosphatase [Rhodoferax sp.]|nr:phosphoglycolate phosphatase [Rhodoferax sp.]
MTPNRLDSSHFGAAIIDLDGTMVDTVGDFVEALQRMLQELPSPYAQFVVRSELVEKLVGKGSEYLIGSLLTHIRKTATALDSQSDPTQEDLQALDALAFQRYQHHYAFINGQYSTQFAGVEEGLQRFKAAAWRLACVTNKPTVYAQQLLDIKGLAKYFELVLGGDALPRKKPDPLPLQVACERLGTTPQRTLMVGDSSNDAQAARAAGCPVVLVTYGYNHGNPIQGVDADGFTDSLADILA